MPERSEDEIINGGPPSGRRSFKKTIKGTFRLFKQESFKSNSVKLRIPSFKGWPRGTKESFPDLKGPCESAKLLKEIPSLDFHKLKADLYIDLAYTNNLLRQRLHRDNRSNFISQLTECLRLIRCRVATAVAYIQLDNTSPQLKRAVPTPPRTSAARSPQADSTPPPSNTAGVHETHPRYYNECRIILEAVSRFENAYITFSAWLAELTSLKPSALDGIVGQLPAPLNCDLPVGPLRSSGASDLVSTPLNQAHLSSTCDGGLPQKWTDSDVMQSSTIMSPIDVAEIMSRGNACFLAVQSAAESIFLSIEASGCDKPTTPLALSSSRISDSTFFKDITTGSGRRSSSFTTKIPIRVDKGSSEVDRKIADETPAVSCSTSGSETSSHGLTPDDRQLLWQLWAQVEPLFDQNNTPPPKPPIPHNAEEPSSPPFSSAGESLATDSGILSDLSLDLFPSTGTYTNVRADTKLNAYLRSLAEAVEEEQPPKRQFCQDPHQVMSTSRHTTADKESLYASLNHCPSTLHQNGHCQPPPPPLPPSPPPRNGKLNCGLNLNDCADLNLPHADDSDASEKENTELGEWRGRREDATSVTVFGATGHALCDSLKSKTSLPVLETNLSAASLPPPPPPPPSAYVIRVTDRRVSCSKPPTGPGRADAVASPELGRTVRSYAPSLGLQTSSVDGHTKVQTLRGKNSPPSWEAMDTSSSVLTASNGRLGDGGQDCVEQSMNPLSDKAMKEEVLNVVLRMHEKQFLKGSSPDHERPTSLPQSPSLPPRPVVVERRKQFVSTPNGPGPEPRCEADSKSDTEDDFELIEVNGKRYRRHFRRHIILQRHKCRQVVVAPSLSDGSGPDLSRQVAKSALQVCQLEEPYDYLPSSEWASTLLTALSEDDKSVGVKTEGSESVEGPTLSESVAEASKCVSSNDAGAPLKVTMAASTDSISPSKTMGNGFNNNLLNYMYRFGRSDLHDPLLDSRISRKVADFFQAKWRKRETAQGPHDRSKTVAYVQKYSQPTGAGTVIQRSTCVQQTCHVRMVGGLQELMQQISSSVPVSIVCTPAPPAPKTSENATSCQLIGKEKPDIDREEKCMQTGDNFANGIFSSGVADNAASNKSAHPMKIDLPRTHTVQHLYSCSSVTAGDPSNSLTVGPVSAPGSTSCSKNGSPSTFRRRHPRPSRRKASLEDPPTNSNSPSDTSHSFPLYDVEVCSVSLPTVEEAERLHPLLAELDATPFLDIENTESDTDLDIQAGTIDALVVYATSIGRAQRSFLLALDVFLFMYRTFMTSEDLINRLIQRYLLFQSSARLQESVEDKTRLKICNFVVSYLIRVVSRLSQDLTPEIYALLQAFRERVLKDGHTALGKALESTLAGALKRMPTKAPLLQPQPTQVPSALPGIESPFYNHDLLHSEPCAVRRSHSIGVVAERSEPASDLETKCLTLQPRDPGGGDSGVSDTTATLREQRPRVGGLWASARNSFSDTNMGVAVSPNQLLQRSSSPSCSTFSDLELDCSQISTPPMGGSCVSSPVMSKRPTPQTGVSREERGSQSVVMSPVATITLTRSPCSSVSIQRRRRLSLLDVPAKLLAEQLTYLEAEKYKHLTLNELLDIRSLVETKAPGVAACAAQFSALSNWAATLLLEPPESQRERCALKLLNTMDHLRALKNFNSFLAILCAFLLIPEDIFSKKTRARLARLRPYMQPPHFSTYRRELAESSPPLIPYLGLTLQNLIVLDQVNAVFLSKVPEAMAAAYKEAHGPIVNFWRCWKHFLIIDFFVKQESSDTRAAHYDIKKDRDVLDFIGDFRTAYPDFALRELINRRKRQAT